jgi:hypothetical protein
MASDGGPDDLPMTLRRQREQKEREARERAQRFEPSPLGPADRIAPDRHPDDFGSPFRDEPQAAVVTAFNVPFFRLMMFLIKCVLAGIPALLLLIVILWGFGQGLKAFAPDLRHFEIIIQPVKKK